MKKNFVIAPIVALLCVTMLASLAAPATAQLTDTAQPTITRYNTYAKNVCSYVSVTNPNGILYPAPDGAWAQFGGSSSNQAKLVAEMTGIVATGTTIAIYAKGSGPLSVYVGTSATGPWTQATVKSGSTSTVSSTNGDWYYFIAPISGQYISIATYGVSIDCIPS
ncbi:MAG: hypothetical protein LBQ98_06330 [Nitrososphaerota archaeon]|jgi:hypothetical protein|nr:hypothetical protein [Nitrososphaerota archaeon]